MSGIGTIDFPENNDVYRRVDGTHILDLYLGRDHLSKYSLMLLSEKEPPRVLSSQVISVEIGRRNDRKWTFSFTLLDKQYLDLFCRFCSDIIESSRTLTDKNKGPLCVYERYNRWQKMLKQSSNGILDSYSIKGLMGELLFLRNYMIPKYGAKNAVDSWLGPEGADQDFIADNTWYEVKATGSGSSSITISSIDQLDSDTVGKLIIIYLDKTSITDNNGLSLNNLYDQIISMLDPESEYRFIHLLSLKGFSKNEEYDKYVYSCKSTDIYRVDEGFPRFRKQNIPSGIDKAVYDLSISFIEKYRENL